MMTRRIFMGAVAAATAASTAGFGIGRSFLTRRRLAMSEINPVALKSLRNHEVILRGPDGRAIKAVLKETDGMSHRAGFNAPATEHVSLVFAAKGPEVAEGTYRVTGPDLDLGNLYLTAVDGTGRHRRLEAVITRIV